MPKSTATLGAYPARLSFIWYLGLVMLGTLLLWQPFFHSGRTPISWIDALFTATSAVCVTGLVVVSTPHDFSFAGQALILLLIQLGGIGIMTVTTYATFHLGGRAGLRERAIIAETLGAEREPDLRWVLRNVIYMTLIFESVGIVVLAVRHLVLGETLVEALWLATFHSISAFCNAGFALFDASLIPYQFDVVINGTISALIIVGGIGFPVMLDFRRNWRYLRQGFWDRLTLHSKMMLIGTAGLLALGTLAILILEWDGVLLGLPVGDKLLISFFQSTVCRTAGFNSVDIAALTDATLLVMMLLMLIGAGPCSTGGGFKVSTFMALVLRAWSTFRGFHVVNVYRRTLDSRNIERAVTTALIFTVVAAIALATLLVVEQSDVSHQESRGVFLDSMFEVISALGTVGLSTGLTPLLSNPARLIIILLMFMGRLGPITMFIALSRSERTQRLERPREDLLIG